MMNKDKILWYFEGPEEEFALFTEKIEALFDVMDQLPDGIVKDRIYEVYYEFGNLESSLYDSWEWSRKELKKGD